MPLTGRLYVTRFFVVGVPRTSVEANFPSMYTSYVVICPSASGGTQDRSSERPPDVAPPVTRRSSGASWEEPPDPGW
ncbi:hypothetical protein NKH77_40945 [Streptomyces sp. M19]